jgi:hypothetical protein
MGVEGGGGGGGGGEGLGGGREEDARAGRGLGEKPNELPSWSNHSRRQAHGEESGGRARWTGGDSTEDEVVELESGGSSGGGRMAMQS